MERYNGSSIENIERRHRKRGSLVVSALAFSARGHGFDPRGRPGKKLVSDNAFLKDDTKYVRLPSDRDVNWRPPVQGESPPVQVKALYSNLHDYL